jgi:hypothetical protein
MGKTSPIKILIKTNNKKMKNRLTSFTLIILAITFAFLSCSKNEDSLPTSTSTSISTTNPTGNVSKKKVRGDNLYDMLGYAFDATGPYLDQMKTAYQVLNIKALKDSANGIISDDPVHTELDIKSGTNAQTLLSKYSNKFSIEGAIPTGAVPFTGSLSSEFVMTNTITSKFSYAFADMNVYISHHAIRQYTDISTLQRYLTTEFKNDINTKTPEQIIAMYGTHVYTDIYTGGKVTFKYQAVETTGTTESSTTYGAKVGVGAATNTNLSLSSTTTYTNTSSSNFLKEYFSYQSVGGTGASLYGSWTPGSAPSVNFNQWSSTVSKSNANSLQLIDVGNNSLMAIYEFVADPVKKAALKVAFDNYILGKTLHILPVVALRRYNYKSNHLYTTNENEFGAGSSSSNNGWYFEGIQAYVCDTQLPNTVPLYRFSKSKTIFLGPTYFDHYYTLDKSSGDKNGYSYEGIQCYVFSSPLNNTVPLYQYYRSSNIDHFYTTDYNELGAGAMGWSLNGPSCYVFNGTR